MSGGTYLVTIVYISRLGHLVGWLVVGTSGHHRVYKEVGALGWLVGWL